MTSTTMTTTSPDTSASESETESQTESESETDATSTGEPLPECEDGQFAGDAPPLGAAVLIEQLDNAQGVEVVDVDDDGDMDVLVGDFGDGQPDQGGIYFIEGNGDGSFQNAVKLPGNYPTIRISAAAISDDTIDVVAMIAEPPNFTLAARRWRGNGDGTFLASVSYPAATDWDVALVDINGDGRRDLLGTSQTGARVSMANASEAFAAYADHGGLPTINGIKGEDVDDDGDGDIVAGSENAVIVLLGNGDGTFAEPLGYALDETPIDSLIGDFDGDGNIDIGATSSAVVWVFPGNGDGTWGARTDLTVQGSTLAGATPDFDGDGCDDITVFNNTGSVSTIMGREGFTFTDQEVFNIVPNGYAYDIAAGDVDGDQIVDVVAVTAGAAVDYGGEVYLLRSGG